MNKRIYVKKKSGFEVESVSLRNDLVHHLQETKIETIDVYKVYDIFNGSGEDFSLLESKVLAELVTDDIYYEVCTKDKDYLAFEFLPGQYDQRSDSAEQCLMLLNNKEGVEIKSGQLLVFNGIVNNFEKIKDYLINPIEMREKDLSRLDKDENIEIEKVVVYDDFNQKTKEELEVFLANHRLAMNYEDLKHIQNYLKYEEKRVPTETEIKVLDTYWSDHCRHTTFETHLTEVSIDSKHLQKRIEESYEKYLSLRESLHGNKKAMTLMDMATIVSKYFSKTGRLDDVEISEENNACSIEIDVETESSTEKWLLMFKNETHNHPTEIEPFGGASTCIGGAIRDPLSGRSYVYQAMRITGAGDITESLDKTLTNKLPQEKISKCAAQGYSSYGNQIGLATTFVKEIFHDGYKAKRMEVGAVVGAVKKEYVKRGTPKAGDIVILIGGRTGRDGIGGATGSSKKHDKTSLEKCASEVQKGNAPTQRRIQRLFRNPEVIKLIKKSNDFGAGGVSVAVGEIARGVEINLDKILVKYQGLNGTELAISESQERMAVVIEKKDKEVFQKLAKEENLESSVIAVITDKERLVIKYKGELLVDIARDFLDTNGVVQEQKVLIKDSSIKNPFKGCSNENIKESLLTVLASQNVASQRGMVEMFDSSVGRSTVLMPYGGKYQLTETEASVQKIPTEKLTKTCSIIAYGYNPNISEYSPYLGAQYAVIESLARIVASGGNYKKARLTFQEYFERLEQNPIRWGKPFVALLGSIEAQMQFVTPAIGGKDSMSGTFKDLNVPPTLISFAVTTSNVDNIISPEFKKKDSYVYYIKAVCLEENYPNYDQIKANFDLVSSEILDKNIISAMTIKFGGVAEALAKMSFGNKIGVNVYTKENIFDIRIGDMLVESTKELNFGILLGTTTEKEYVTINDNEVAIDELIVAWESTYKNIYPYNTENTGNIVSFQTIKKEVVHSKTYYEKQPRVLIAVFPGTNSEYDTKKAFERAGGDAELFVFNNLNVDDIRNSIDSLAKCIKNSQIFVIPGGFSAGDEPDGSGKFIANILQNNKIKEAINHLLKNDGLILGICNGFQALVKSGLLPYGDLSLLTEESPTLFKNNINRHVSRVAPVKVVSTNSPWMTSFNEGDMFSMIFSHGEGKFVVSEALARELFEKGQVVTQYCTLDGDATMDKENNINGSYYAIEGIVSPSGQILGRMSHPERYEEGLLKNIQGNKLQDIFSNGINHFKNR